MAPELVGVDLAVPAHAGYAVARAVALVPLQQLHDLGGALRVLLEQLHVHERRVGMVVDRQDLGRVALVEPLPGAVHDQADGLAGLLVCEVLVDHLAAAPGVHEVVEARAVDALALHEVEHVVDLAPVVLVDGEAQTDLDAGILRVVHAFERLGVRAFHTAEAVVRGLVAVKGDADVGKPHGSELLGELGGDERAVRGDDDAHARVLGVLHELEQVLADARLAAREQGSRRLPGRRSSPWPRRWTAGRTFARRKAHSNART